MCAHAHTHTHTHTHTHAHTHTQERPQSLWEKIRKEAHLTTESMWIGQLDAENCIYKIGIVAVRGSYKPSHCPLFAR